MPITHCINDETMKLMTNKHPIVESKVYSFFWFVFVNCSKTAGPVNTKLGAIDHHALFVVQMDWRRRPSQVSGKDVNVRTYVYFTFSKTTGSTNVKHCTINQYIKVRS